MYQVLAVHNDLDLILCHIFWHNPTHRGRGVSAHWVGQPGPPALSLRGHGRCAVGSSSPTQDSTTSCVLLQGMVAW